MADVATIDPDKTANSHAAIPEAARKAAGPNAAEPSQPPNAGKAVNAEPIPDNSVKRPGAVSNSPTRSELEASYQVNTTPEHVNRLSEPQAGDPERVVEDKPKRKRSSAKKSSAKKPSASAKKSATKRSAKKSAKKGK